MSLLIPDHYVEHETPPGPFNREFFAAHFRAGVAPSCELFSEGEVPVVELELVNGETCDVFAFEAFKRDHIVAQLFVDPPRCEEFYLSFIRYETIFRVNVRYYAPPQRELGFRLDKEPEVEQDAPAPDPS
jgi:hypothetical protein